MSSIEKTISQRIDFNSDEAMQKIVYDTLKQAILDGTVPPGSKLNINSLAETLNVSRTPIRQACKKLTDEGLIFMVPNQGATIRPIDKVMIDEIFQLYSLLIKEIIKAVIENITNSDIMKIKELYSEVINNEKYDPSIHIIKDQVRNFTDTLIAVAKRPITIQSLRQVTSYLKEFNQELTDNKNQMLILLREFLTMVNYIEKQNTNSALELVDRQTQRLYHLAITWYDADEDHNVEEWPCVHYTCPIVSALYNFNNLEMPELAES